MAAPIIYATAMMLWGFLWYTADGYRLMGEVRLMWLPFCLCLLYLAGNLVLVAMYGQIGDVPYEESRFVFIGERAQIAVQATASVLIVATIVYGLTIRRVPVNFIRFMVYTFVTLLGLMAPILWIPLELAEGFYVLRHFQTAALTYALFFCVGGIVLLLDDLLTHGDARISLEYDDSEWGAVEATTQRRA